MPYKSEITPKTSGDLEREIERFINFEATLLDEWKLEDWAKLFTEDARYWIPADLPDGRPGEVVGLVDDDTERIRGRVQRLLSRHAHADVPRPRTRRFITNIRVEPVNGDDVSATASFLVYRYRNNHLDPFIGQYRYLLRRADGTFRIRSRAAILDMEALDPQSTINFIL